MIRAIILAIAAAVWLGLIPPVYRRLAIDPHTTTGERRLFAALWPLVAVGSAIITVIGPRKQRTAGRTYRRSP